MQSYHNLDRMSRNCQLELFPGAQEFADLANCMMINMSNVAEFAFSLGVWHSKKKKRGLELIYTAVWLCDLFLKPSLQGPLLWASTSMFILNSEAFVRPDFVSLTGNTDPLESHNQRDGNIKKDGGKRRVREGLPVAPWAKINIRLTMTPWRWIPNSEDDESWKKRTDAYSNSLASLAYFCIWNSIATEGRDLWVLKERMCDLRWETERAARIPRPPSWEDSTRIKEALWIFKRGDWDELGGHVKGLGAALHASRADAPSSPRTVYSFPLFR